MLTGKYNGGVPADSRLAPPGLEWLRDRLTGQANDRDGYGLANLFEMLLGGNPAAAEALPPLRYDARSGSVIFSLPGSHTSGFRVGSESSSNLATWVPVPLLAPMIWLQPDGARVVVPSSSMPGSRFWRLQAQADLTP